jgi:hypothetical protein
VHEPLAARLHLGVNRISVTGYGCERVEVGFAEDAFHRDCFAKRNADRLAPVNTADACLSTMSHVRPAAELSYPPLHS